MSNNVVAIFSEAHLESVYTKQGAFNEIDDVLRNQLGFVLYNIYPCMKDKSGKAVQLDALWVSPNILSTRWVGV